MVSSRGPTTNKASCRAVESKRNTLTTTKRNGFGDGGGGKGGRGKGREGRGGGKEERGRGKVGRGEEKRGGERSRTLSIRWVVREKGDALNANR